MNRRPNAARARNWSVRDVEPGGLKLSGWGRELSQHGLDGYLNVKDVWINKD